MGWSENNLKKRTGKTARNIMNKTVTQYALITGASSGIGNALARLFAKGLIDLVLVARREETLLNLKHELESQYSITVHVLAEDLSDPDAPERIFKYTEEKNIFIEYLVNNAGFGLFGFFIDTDWQKEEQMLQVNISALTALTKFYGRKMGEKQYGRILNIASTAAFQPGPLMSVYYATKHYVLAFSEAIANELKDKQVTVTTLCPGPTASEFQSTANAEDSKLFKNKKLPTAEEVARYGYKMMMKGKTLAIHGGVNKLMATGVRFLPRKWVTQIVRIISEKAS